MPTLLMKLSSKFGNVVKVIKNNDKYYLFANEKIMMCKEELDEDGVSTMKSFTDILLEEGWYYEVV